MLQFCNLEREDFIAHSVKVSEELLCVFRFQIFKQVLDVNFNISLLVTVSVLLFLYVFHSRISLALLLPVKFLRNVSGCDSNRQVQVDFVHDVIQNAFVLDARQVRVQREVFCHDSLRDLLQRLDFVGGKGHVSLFLGLHDGFGDEAVVESLAFFGFFGLSLRGLTRSGDFGCK